MRVRWLRAIDDGSGVDVLAFRRHLHHRFTVGWCDCGGALEATDAHRRRDSGVWLLGLRCTRCHAEACRTVTPAEAAAPAAA